MSSPSRPRTSPSARSRCWDCSTCARVDMRVDDDDDIYVLEVNSLPIHECLQTEDVTHPYYLRPNAVPWASVAPTIVFRASEPWLAIGSPGSERIPPTILQVLLRLGTRHRCSGGRAPHPLLAARRGFGEGVTDCHRCAARGRQDPYLLEGARLPSAGERQRCPFGAATSPAHTAPRCRGCSSRCPARRFASLGEQGDAPGWILAGYIRSPQGQGHVAARGGERAVGARFGVGRRRRARLVDVDAVPAGAGCRRPQIPRLGRVLRRPLDPVRRAARSGAQEVGAQLAARLLRPIPAERSARPPPLLGQGRSKHTRLRPEPRTAQPRLSR